MASDEREYGRSSIIAAIGGGDDYYAWLALLAAIYRQAVIDARRGEYDAICFMDDQFPDYDWGRYSKKYKTHSG